MYTLTVKRALWFHRINCKEKRGIKLVSCNYYNLFACLSNYFRRLIAFSESTNQGSCYLFSWFSQQFFFSFFSLPCYVVLVWVCRLYTKTSGA